MELNDIDDYIAINYHMARHTLKIDTGSFYDKWSFLWLGQLILATVSRFNEQVHLVTSFNFDRGMTDFILEFIEMEKEDRITNEDQESWN